ncbi:MAG: DUF3021 domain-containing protein [Clostridia bacterium]|nr:DUF3021 domain-containing protein [Clostridia bacterium]
MKKFISDFFLRGLMAAAGGPVVLAIVYGILGATGEVSSFTPKEVCLGIFTITLLALFVGGMTAIYQVEKLPLVSAILIHGAGLYVAYILIYLINGWLKRQLVPVLIFTAVFIVGYAVIWLIIYRCTKIQTDRINKKL